MERERGRRSYDVIATLSIRFLVLKLLEEFKFYFQKRDFFIVASCIQISISYFAIDDDVII